jgi:hypothetical protein
MLSSIQRRRRSRTTCRAGDRRPASQPKQHRKRSLDPAGTRVTPEGRTSGTLLATTDGSRRQRPPRGDSHPDQCCPRRGITRRSRTSGDALVPRNRRTTRGWFGVGARAARCADHVARAVRLRRRGGGRRPPVIVAASIEERSRRATAPRVEKGGCPAPPCRSIVTRLQLRGGRGVPRGRPALPAARDLRRVPRSETCR